jgi:hypothetical protein
LFLLEAAMLRSPVGHEGAVDDVDGVLAWSAGRRDGQQGRQVIEDAVGRGLRDPEQGRHLPQCEVRAPVRRHQQHPVLQRQPPGTTALNVTTATPHQRDQPGELRLGQTGERLDPLRIIR